MFTSWNHDMPKLFLCTIFAFVRLVTVSNQESVLPEHISDLNSCYVKTNSLGFQRKFHFRVNIDSHFKSINWLYFFRLHRINANINPIRFLSHPYLLKNCGQIGAHFAHGNIKYPFHWRARSGLVPYVLHNVPRMSILRETRTHFT